MPWVYALDLAAKVPAGEIAADWEASHPGVHPDLGVSQAGLTGCIVTFARDPNHTDFAAEAAYVVAIEEFREVPAPADAAWDPPELGHPSGSIEWVGE